MALPIVVIVGRPNVGKSSLLNSLARERISIVDPRAGTTRDRVSSVLEVRDRYIELVDTGGIGIIDEDRLEAHVEDQIRYALARADLIVFVVDAQSGVSALDQTVAELLRKLDRPVILAANKVDDPSHEALAAEFETLGFGEPVPISALHGLGRESLIDRVLDVLGPPPDEALEPPVMKLAIVGKRNAGKSTVVNVLAGEARVIVSEIPGTTRDAVDVQFEKDGRKFIAIDTAGVRKKRRMDSVDFYSYTRALRSIQRADVVLLLIDSLVPVGSVDQRLARAVLDEYKPVVIGINKWDLARDRATTGDFATYLTETLPALKYAPITFLTAKVGKNIDAAVDVALSLHKQAHTRIPTGRLNQVLEDILALRGPSPKRGTRAVKVYYATQVAVAPPSFVFFCNDPALVREDYRRFMENRLREVLPMKEVPLRLLFRPRSATRREKAGAGG